MRKRTPEEIVAYEAEQIRLGLHSTTIRTVCEGCREWCDGIYHFQLDGKGICRACAVKSGLAKPVGGGK